MQVLCWIFLIDIFLIALAPIIAFGYLVFRLVEWCLTFLDEEDEDEEDMEA